MNMCLATGIFIERRLNIDYQTISIYKLYNGYVKIRFFLRAKIGLISAVIQFIHWCTGRKKQQLHTINTSKRTKLTCLVLKQITRSKQNCQMQLFQYGKALHQHLNTLQIEFSKTTSTLLMNSRSGKIICRIQHALPKMATHSLALDRTVSPL